MHVRQAAIDPVVPIRELGVIDAQLVQQRRMIDESEGDEAYRRASATRLDALLGGPPP